MTVDELLRKAYQFIHKDEARLLLSILMNYDTLELNLHLEDNVEPDIEKKFKDAVILLKQGKPLQYVLSNAPFYGYDFYVKIYDSTGKLKINEKFCSYRGGATYVYESLIKYIILSITPVK